MTTIERWQQRFERERSARREAESLLHDKSRELFLANEALSTRADELAASMQQLKDAQEALVRQEKLAALGGLVAGVAHEVNTPIGVAVTAVSLTVESVNALEAMIASGRLSKSGLNRLIASMNEGLELAGTNLQRAAELVQSFKKVAVDQSSGALRNADLGELVRDIISSLGPVLRRAQVEISAKLPSALRVKVDAGGISQVLTNLIQNACIHAWPVDRGERQIEVTLVDTGEGITLTVSDNGVGMDEATAAQVWEPFFTTKRGDGGSGLGMHITHNLIVERFQGSIYVDTAPEKGCSWRITIPDKTEAFEVRSRG